MFDSLIKLRAVRNYSAEELKWALWVYQQVDIKIKLDKSVRADSSDWHRLLRRTVSKTPPKVSQ